MPETETPTVWAIILHWRLWHITLQCVQSLLESTWPALHILIVDNGSQDDSLEKLRLQLPDGVHMIALPENRYFAGGINAGLAWALCKKGDWFLVMNNDTWVAPHMVTQLIAAAQSHAAAGIVAPMIYYAGEPKRVWSAGARSRQGWPFPQELSHRLSSSIQAPYPVDYVTGCGMMISRKVLEHLGLFDERYQMYYEDADFCERVRQAGYQILVVPAARMWHLVGRTSAEVPVINRYQRTRNRWRFYMAHRQGWMRIMVGALLLAQGFAWGAKYYLTGRQALGKAHWRGMWHGLRGVE